MVLAPVLINLNEHRSEGPDLELASLLPFPELEPDDEHVADEALAVDTDAFMPQVGPGRLRVASFNMLNVGERAAKDFGRLARIVRQFDLCAVLELQNEQALRDLIAALGDEWAHVISDREVGVPEREKTFEYYGFVYRTEKVVPLDGPTGFFPDPDAIYSREPYFASFRSGSFDFTAITLHAESPAHGWALTAELEHLPDLFQHVQSLDPDENDILLMGDFNRSPSTQSGNQTRAWRALLSLPEMDCVIVDGQLTTLSSHATGLANHYDEICLTRNNTSEFTGSHGAFDFVTSMFEGQNKPAKHFVSDHLPVWAEFRTDGADDDGTDTATSDGCCRICRTSKACGDSCIAANFICTREPGCACDG